MSEGRERLARQLEMKADWCERHHPGCDCVRIYRANAAMLRAQTMRC